MIAGGSSVGLAPKFPLLPTVGRGDSEIMYMGGRLHSLLRKSMCSPLYPFCHHEKGAEQMCSGKREYDVGEIIAVQKGKGKSISVSTRWS